MGPTFTNVSVGSVCVLWLRCMCVLSDSDQLLFGNCSLIRDLYLLPDIFCRISLFLRIVLSASLQTCFLGSQCAVPFWGLDFSLGLFCPHPPNPVSWGVSELFLFGIWFFLSAIFWRHAFRLLRYFGDTPFASCDILATRLSPLLGFFCPFLLIGRRHVVFPVYVVFSAPVGNAAFWPASGFLAY